MWNDLRFVARMLLRRPSFAVLVILTLALGIGGSVAIFSIVNAVLLRDLPYPNPDRIYLMRSMTPDGLPTGNLAPPELRPFFEVENHPVVQAAALAWSQGVQITGTDGRSHSTTRYGVTDQFFDVFGPAMFLGRPFARNEGPGVIVLAYPLWRDVFNSDPEIVGKIIQAEGAQYRVIGIARADFEFPENPGYWYLMRLGPAYDRTRSYRGFVRLRAGHSAEEFRAEATTRSRQLGPDPVTGQRPLLVVQPFLYYVVGDLRPTVTILFGATAVLLLIACINVTNLFLARATARAREMAVRGAIGAGRRRVLRQLLTESVFVSALGGVIGVGAAVAAVRILLRIAPPELPRLQTVPLDGRVLFFAVGITILTGLMVGLAPAWHLITHPLATLMKEGGRGGTVRHRLFSALVVTEIALAVPLVIGAGLLVRSYFKLAATNPGFNPDRVLTAFMFVPGHVSMSVTRDANGRPQFNGSYAPMATFYNDLESRIRALPGVTAVASTTSLPLSRAQYDGLTAFHVLGQAQGSGDETAQWARSRTVSAGFFDVMQIPIMAGRALLASDTPSAPGVAVVDQTFARRFFPGQNPLGGRIRYVDNRFVPGDTGFQISQRTVDELEIVGVAGDVKYLALAEPPEPSIYLSRDQWTNRRQTLVIRAAVADAEGLTASVRHEIEAMEPLQTADFSRYPTIVRASLAGERLAATLLVVLGVMALVLAAVGIYGLMSYAVEQRVGEIAVRSAMGASASQVIALVMKRGVGLAAGGIGLGVAGAIALRRVVASQLYGVTGLDAQVFVLTILVLFGVAVAACFVPARRAIRIQPADLLRIE
jgi:putative ABC transport system permease protein